MSIKKDINSLQGPILIIGASGFVGANIFKKIKNYREDVFGTSFSGAGWRFKDTSSILHMNMCDINNVNDVFKKVEPKTIFDCSSFGAYSFEKNIDLIHKTNYLSLIEIFETLEYHDISAYIHAGSSSEYGLNSASPSEDVIWFGESLLPKSDRVNSPSHYTSGKQEVIDIIEDAIEPAPSVTAGFLQAQVLKYLLRVWLKNNPLQDLKKAQWYLTRLIDSL